MLGFVGIGSGIELGYEKVEALLFAGGRELDFVKIEREATKEFILMNTWKTWIN